MKQTNIYITRPDVANKTQITKKIRSIHERPKQPNSLKILKSEDPKKKKVDKAWPASLFEPTTLLLFIQRGAE